MARSTAWLLHLTVAAGLVAGPAYAQGVDPVDEAPAAAAAPAGTGASEAGAASRFATDVMHDYRNFVSMDTARRLGTGAVAALAIHAGDEAMHDEFLNPDALPGGNAYGLFVVQVPMAVGWWVVGRAMDNVTTSETGRDLVRAQISSISWTYAAKFAFRRERPNGDPRAFPSGHASSSFATAAILQQHYGWKVGVPAFAAAAYTAASRVTAGKHWPSDVVFGACLGLQSARVVTIRLREGLVSIAPVPVAGGGAVMFTVRAEP